MDNNQPTKKERRELKRQEKAADQDRARQKRTLKRIFTWLITIVILAGAVFGFYKLGTGQPGGGGAGSALAVAVAEDDWIKGNSQAKVTLVEYGDFQCPACGAYHPILKQLEEEFSDGVRFVYRHFPLTRIHQYAEIAARAAEAAGKQGKFWEMHDLIFENQNIWSRGKARDAFEGYARELGLDVGRYQTDMGLGETKDKIDDDYDGGVASGINSTPSFFLNGVKINNPGGLDDFRNLLNAAIQETSNNETP